MATAKTTSKKVHVRMYNVGLGDCFLLRFPDEHGGERKVLIDCGVHISGPGPRKMTEVVDQIIEDVTDDGTPRIDIVIATHRHRDHVSGFEAERWGEVEVGEVWLPWTEHPTDLEAKKIRDKQSKAGAKAKTALAAFGASPAILQIVDNSLTNAAAMATLQEGWANKPKLRYLPPKKRSDQTFTTDLLPGVTVHAMGPSRDPEVIRDMDPPKGGAYELRMAALSGRDANAASIFPKTFQLTGEARQKQLDAFDLRDADIADLETLADEDAFSVAVQIDKAVNGTSLMIMFEVGRAYMLFPGDAQWGTWQNALGDPEFKDLLMKTNFLKVGHHGSHNATPKDFVTDVLAKNNFIAMICTRETKVFKKIPLESLLTALDERSGRRIVRSDQTDSVKGFKRKDDVYTDAWVSS
jgi:beta-lactamase superfamily II metal-dependent hydrolase